MTYNAHAHLRRLARAMRMRIEHVLSIPHFSKNVPCACGWTLNRTKKVLKSYEAHAHEHTQRMRMAYDAHAHEHTQRTCMTYYAHAHGIQCVSYVLLLQELHILVAKITDLLHQT